MTMRVLLLTGIWPPDVGGPATHGPELVRFLLGRGHGARVVTMGDRPPSERPCAVDTVPRSLPFPLRYGLVAARGARAARGADVVYASGTYAAAAVAATVARRPLVVKLVSDPAYERAVRLGLFRGTLEDFQEAPASRPLAAARTAVLRSARRVVVPSAYLARLAGAWGIERSRIEVVPNPAPPVEPGSAPASPPTFVFAGRLAAQKALGTALDAIARVPDVRLVIIGDGPERVALEERAAALEGRVELLGALPRERVLEALRGATAAVIPSDWENLPHAALEALALGVPVVATAVGGVPEVVRDGENGLLVPPGSPQALAAALERVAGDRDLRDRLAAGALLSVADLSHERVYGRIEQILVSAAR
jgi:glycosyltransferase involved in cell wall biosynthesis